VVTGVAVVVDCDAASSLVVLAADVDFAAEEDEPEDTERRESCVEADFVAATSVTAVE
jgi:hypothetical protein